MLYFYIQNLRFLIKKTKSNNFIFNYNLNVEYKGLVFLVFFSFFNVFSIFFFSDWLIILNNISLFLYLS